MLSYHLGLVYSIKQWKWKLWAANSYEYLSLINRTSKNKSSSGWASNSVPRLYVWHRHLLYGLVCQSATGPDDVDCMMLQLCFHCNLSFAQVSTVHQSQLRLHPVQYLCIFQLLVTSPIYMLTSSAAAAETWYQLAAHLAQVLNVCRIEYWMPIFSRSLQGTDIILIFWLFWHHSAVCTLSLPTALPPSSSLTSISNGYNATLVG